LGTSYAPNAAFAHLGADGKQATSAELALVDPSTFLKMDV